MTKEICHVCGKEKKPYTVFVKNDIFSIMQYKEAREKGPICQRCDRYYAMTGELKEPTEKEFEIAKKAMWFANMIKKWWEKDQKLEFKSDESTTNKRDWEGMVYMARWCRDELNKGDAP